ncbi:hypothetical protein Pmani_024545 [Petrolisthes manimaculis]|uniref:Uncharacterized protein n=1 Tax=Petrolisthes manimaculis TaxID=1843537 RepID=A0AAE1TYK4_9EUCA|nr:hypothetical protein Pmani_024545 [Petrolisthes manimaculis]
MDVEALERLQLGMCWSSSSGCLQVDAGALRRTPTVLASQDTRWPWFFPTEIDFITSSSSSAGYIPYSAVNSSSTLSMWLNRQQHAPPILHVPFSTHHHHYFNTTTTPTPVPILSSPPPPQPHLSPPTNTTSFLTITTPFSTTRTPTLPPTTTTRTPTLPPPPPLSCAHLPLEGGNNKTHKQTFWVALPLTRSTLTL